MTPTAPIPRAPEATSTAPAPPQLPCPRDATRPDGDCTVTRRLPADAWCALLARAAAHDLPAPVVLAAAFARTVADWSKEPRFTLDADGVPLPVDADPHRGLLDCARALGSARPRPELPLRLRAGLRYEAAADAAGGLLLTWDAAGLALPEGLLEDLADTHLLLLQQPAEAWQEAPGDPLPARQQLVREQVNSTGAPLADDLLHEPFWRRAELTPDAPAVITAARTVSYRELRAAATRVAEQLPDHRARPAMVAVVLDKGWEQAAAVLGTLAAGAAYVPIAPDLPAERFHHLLAHAQAAAAVTTAQLARTLPWPDGLPLIVLDESDLAGEGERALPRRRGQRDLAYVIYTSGSTGRPKGVMIDHRGALNTITDINRRFAIGPTDRVFALSALSFDLSVYDILGPLSVGGALVMPGLGSSRAPWEWAGMLAEHRVTVWNTVPALMELLVEYTACRQQRLAGSLRLVLMSGDWIPVSLPDRIRALAAPGIEVIGAGGATEASIWSNCYPIGEVDPAWPSIPYGRPLTNQHFEVLDSALRRRPDWVPGELHIGGHGVAMGYWRDEERTKASFLTHPRTGERLYRTGDLGRYLPDGNLEFLGREDFQVKIHGFRVELGEIEAAVLAHEQVAAAVVTAVDAPGGAKRLVAYVTPAHTAPGELREHLAAKLPAYLVPDQFVALDALPLTANGKVDRTALPVPGAAGRR
ncbi:amino acid adenylation domain-containing protein [Kitasatospora sp. NPDC049258]|uniref:amino acid adenylation domain-containing protein n=1 Tax=Kitasatospora sp. NPDC049258 TaxID=3155394 RepID=UPI003422392C